MCVCIQGGTAQLTPTNRSFYWRWGALVLAGHNLKKLIKERLEVFWHGRPKLCFQIRTECLETPSEMGTNSQPNVFSGLGEIHKLRTRELSEAQPGCLGLHSAFLVSYLFCVTRCIWSFVHFTQILKFSLYLFKFNNNIYNIQVRVTRVAPRCTPSPTSANQRLCAQLSQKGKAKVNQSALELPDLLWDFPLFHTRKSPRSDPSAKAQRISLVPAHSGLQPSGLGPPSEGAPFCLPGGMLPDS